MNDPAALRFSAASEILVRAVETHAAPAAVVEVGRRTGPLWAEAFGTLTYDADAAPTTLDTIFDLASLTKVLATTTLVMREIRQGRLGLDVPLASILRFWRGEDRKAATIRNLLDHSSGLPAHRRLWEQAQGRDEYERAISALPLESSPGSQSVYSDVGFILLGFVVEDVANQSLAQLWDEWRRTALPSHMRLSFGPVIDNGSVAPTERDPWRGRVLRGEVHDENAAALGGVAAHAGLFGTVQAVGAMARLVLETLHTETPLGMPTTMRLFSRASRGDSSRALGWDTMRPTSSCGTLMSATAIGHTGFTGTSLWIDPERDVYVVLLTNRVHPTRENQTLPRLRPTFHDAVLTALR